MRERLQVLSERLGAWAWSLVLVLRWLHTQVVQPPGRFFVETWLPIWEETVKVRSARGPGRVSGGDGGVIRAAGAPPPGRAASAATAPPPTALSPPPNLPLLPRCRRLCASGLRWSTAT